MHRRALVLLISGLGAGACTAPPPVRAPSSHAELVAPDGTGWNLSDHLAESSFTVLFFFSPTCPCQAAHDRRLVDLARQWGPRGVRFYAIDSERGGGPERDFAEARSRGYPFPILVDPKGELARDLRAEYATYAVVLDREGRIVYRGGIDTDRKTLHAGATPYLQDALEDLASGRPPRVAEGEALGCALHRW
jgi:hypothetical protein